MTDPIRDAAEATRAYLREPDRHHCEHGIPFEKECDQCRTYFQDTGKRSVNACLKAMGVGE